MNIDSRYINQIEVVNNIFSVIDGKIKILLFKREEEPFKGYWMLPSNLLMVSETVEDCAKDTIFEYGGFKDLYTEQCCLISKIDRLPSDRILANVLIALVDSETLKFNREKRRIESEWFDIDEIPKTVFDHNIIIDKAVKYLKKKICQNELLTIFFPSDFSLPELQTVYEQAFEKKLDRRNFRKKMINMNIVEDTGYKNTTNFGRPPKLYRFKEQSNNFLNL